VKKWVACFVVLLGWGASLLVSQTKAPLDKKTLYFRQTEVVKNGQRTAGDNSGQFITFTFKGCYDSNKQGQSVNNGFLEYRRTVGNIHVYEGGTFWGQGAYRFAADFSRMNVVVNGVVYVYQQAAAPAEVASSAKIKPGRPGGTAAALPVPVAPVNPGQTFEPDPAIWNPGPRSAPPSGRTRTCDLCLGKGQLWEYTGGAGDNRTTVYCSVSGCTVKSPHRHITCHRCGGSGSLNL
jgi:hypothetical protein